MGAAPHPAAPGGWSTLVTSGHRFDRDVMPASVLAEYLARIGLSATVRDHPLDARLLATVLTAQLATIPFENLDIHRGIGVELDPAVLEDKLVRRRRGGICYELNGLLARALRTLGFRAYLTGAAVLTDGVPGPPLGHAAITVDLDGRPWLADAGFGGDALLCPLPDAAAGAAVDAHLDGGAGYRLDTRPRPLTDFVAMAHWHSTSPRSRFTGGIVCSVTGPAGRHTLSCAPGARYRWTVTAGSRRRTRDLDAAEAAGVLRREFGITLPDPPRPRRFS